MPLSVCSGQLARVRSEGDQMRAKQKTANTVRDLGFGIALAGSLWASSANAAYGSLFNFEGEASPACDWSEL